MALINVKIGALEYSAAQGISAPHCFTTRLGGVSTGHLESLNLSPSRGDKPENVIENYRRVGEILGFAPEDVVIARQTHSDIVMPVGSAQRGAGLTAPALEECDGLITNTPGLALFVSTADCTPILFYDPVSGAVGAAHAGWRGTAADIAGKTVKAMTAAFGTAPEQLRCAIGPNIGVCHFETGGEVPRAVLDTFGDAAMPCIRRAGEKFYLDLKGINALALRRAGVEHIEISEECTMCRPDRFWSHRVTQGCRGAQGAIILCTRP